MKSHVLACAIVAALLASVARANSEMPVFTLSAEDAAALDVADDTDDEVDFTQHQVDLFDRLRMDPSPRQQVLVADEYLPDDAVGALRPKLADVVARAVNLAPDDAFVQWYAAQSGSFTSSSCGPTTWPEAEVANLIRLEPDNGVTWTFAIALAAAIGDEGGVDDALSRLASTSRADDHAMEAFTEWRKAYASGHADMASMPWLHDVPPDLASYSLALVKLASSRSPVSSALKRVCSTEAGERTWRRLGWCADAGVMLASKANSIELRQLGVEMLEAIGDRSAETLALKQQVAWFASHDPGTIHLTHGDDPEARARLSDWEGARDRIEVIERSIARGGEPLQAPAEWVDPSAAEAENMKAAEAAGMDYLTTLITAMRADENPRVRAYGEHIAGLFQAYEGMQDPASPDAAAKSASAAPIDDLAAAHPDDVLIQWIATTSPASRNAAIGNLQRLEPDNLATRLQSLNEGASDPSTVADVLARAASATTYREPLDQLLRLMMDVVERHPPPAEMQDTLRGMGHTSTGNAAVAYGMSIAYTSSWFGLRPDSLQKACIPPAGQEWPERRADCIVIGRMLLHEGNTSLAALVGAGVLMRLGESAPADQERMRHVAWWNQTASRHADTMDFEPVVRDLLDTANEIETWRRATKRLGDERPPPEWTSPWNARQPPASADDAASSP